MSVGAIRPREREIGLDGAECVGKNNCMEIIVRAVQTGLVWLTAVTTLVGSVPHFDCLCPNGQHKLFCLGISASPTGCCCGGSCCSSSESGKCCCQARESSPEARAKHLRCCCESQRQTSADAPGPGLQVKGSCCQKTVIRDELVGVSPTKESPKQNGADGFSVVLPPLALVHALPVVSESWLSWHRYDLPPPTDLVITLQHFLI